MSVILTTGGPITVDQDTESIRRKYRDASETILFTRTRVEGGVFHPGAPLYLVRSAIVGWHQ